jgi:hypothetical protein
MTDTLDRFTSALQDRYSIDRELGAGGVVATDSRGSADVAESDMVYEGAAQQDVTFSDISREAALSGWKKRDDGRPL